MLKTSCRSWTFAVLGLAALVSGGANVLASPIQATIGYDTTGSVGTTGVSGTPVVSFLGVAGGSSVAGTPFSFGNFVVALPPAGTDTTYSKTPFTIQYDVKTVSGSIPSPNEGSVTIHGVLDGTVRSNGQSDLTPSFGFVPDPSTPDLLPLATFYTAGSIVNHLFPVLSARPTFLSTAEGGVNSLDGALGPVTVPEPTPLALYACIVSLLICGHGRGPRPTSPRNVEILIHSA